VRRLASHHPIFLRACQPVGKKQPAPQEGELSEVTIVSFLGTREGAALVRAFMAIKQKPIRQTLLRFLETLKRVKSPNSTLAMPPRRFPAPWSIEEGSACFIVRDHDTQALAHVYFETEPGRRSSAKTTHARRGIPYRGEHRHAAKRAAADIEGHSRPPNSAGRTIEVLSHECSYRDSHVCHSSRNSMAVLARPSKTSSNAPLKRTTAKDSGPNARHLGCDRCFCGGIFLAPWICTGSDRLT